MTKPQEQFLLDSLYRFVQSASEKYKKGQDQHGGQLWEKKYLIKKAKEECIDQWFYLDAIEKQIVDKTIYTASGVDKDE